MICSRCQRDLPESQFSPKRFSQTAHYNKALELVTYRNRCKRGRHYNCHECRREAYKLRRYAKGP
jgi:hypothetical protein